MSNFIKDFNYDRGQFLKDSDIVGFRVSLILTSLGFTTVNESLTSANVIGNFSDDDYRGNFKSDGTANGSTKWKDASNNHTIEKEESSGNPGKYIWVYKDQDNRPAFTSDFIEGANENTKDYPWNVSTTWSRFGNTDAQGGDTDASTAVGTFRGFDKLIFSDFTVTSSLDEFHPVPGAQMDFTASNSAWNASNYNSFISPMGVNSLMLKSKLSFIEDLDRTKTLLNYLQSKTTGTLTGDEAFTGNLNYVNFGEINTLYYNNFEDLETGTLTEAETKEKLSNNQLIVTQKHGGVSQSIVSVETHIGPHINKTNSFNTSSSNMSFQGLKILDAGARFGLEFSGFPEQTNYIVSGKYVTSPRYESNKIGLEVRTSINGAVSDSNSDSSGTFSGSRVLTSPTREMQNEFLFTGIVGTGGTLEVNMKDGRPGAKDTADQGAIIIDELAIMKNEGAVINLDNSGIYQNFSGSQISDFTVTDIGKDIYKIDVSLFNNAVSSVLNNGQGFIKPVQLYYADESAQVSQTFSKMHKEFYLNNHSNDPKTGYEVYNKFDVIEKTGTNDFKWVCFSGGEAEIAMPFPNTEIYKETWPTIRDLNASLPEGANRTKVVSASSKTKRTTLILEEGKFYRATKYVNITRSNQNHVIAPFSLAGQAFSFTTARNAPHRTFVCNISNQAQTITRTIGSRNTTNSNGVNDTTPDATSGVLELASGEIGTMEHNFIGIHYLSGTAGSTNGFDRNFIVASVALSTPTSSADVDKMLITPVVTSNRKLNTYTYRRRTDDHHEAGGGTHSDRDLIHQQIQSSFFTNNALYAESGVSATEIGDGAGGDSCQSLGINNLYNYAAYGNKLQDYAIVTPYSGHIDISYYSGDSWYLYTGHDLTGGASTSTQENPTNPFPQGLDPHFVFRNAISETSTAMAGNTTTFFNDQNLWKFESTCPVGIWINDPSADEEVLVGTDSIIGNQNSQRRPHGLHNYFYVSGDTKCLGPELQGEAGFTGGIGATRSFFWEPDRSVPIKIDHTQRIRKFKYSFDKMLNLSKNQNRINSLELRFSNRTNKEAYSLLHFLESHLGYKHFVYKHNLNAINNNKVFYCPKWNHVFNFKDSNTITATFVEIVSPAVPEL